MSLQEHGPAVLVDLDSTLALTQHRHHLSPHADPANTWETYASACADDEPNLGVIRALQLYARAGLSILVVTARPTTSWADTQDWLDKHQVPVDRLRMRRSSEEGSHVEYKLRLLGEMRMLGYSPVLAFEDWPDIAAAYQEAGVPTVLVNPGYHDNPMAFYVSHGVSG